jgi:hypothetical protein
MTTNVQTEQVGSPGALASQIFAAAWMSVALGFTLEGLSALGAYALGRDSTPQTFLANVGHKVSWGTLVCVGLAFAKVFRPKDLGASAWAGMFAAPTAFTVARAVHKGLAQAMGLSVAPAAPALLLLLATVKSLEYGVLGALLARLDERETATVGSYVRTATWVGLLFGGATLAAAGFLSPAGPSAADWFARGVNEFIFPVGCALILFSATAPARRLNL